jgi:hypothetical protein
MTGILRHVVPNFNYRLPGNDRTPSPIWHIFLLLLAGLTASAASVGANAADAVTYRIDLLIFRQLKLQTDEDFSRAGGPSFDESRYLLSYDAVPGEKTYPLSSPDNFLLSDSLARINGSNSYRHVWHGSWKLALQPQRKVRFRLAPDNLQEQNFTLSADLGITLSRYLHIDADLALAEWEPAPAGYRPADPTEAEAQAYADAPFSPVVNTRPSGSTTAINGNGSVANPSASWAPWGNAADSLRAQNYQVKNVYRIAKKQRSRRDVLYYIDHPYFGMVYKFTKVDAPQGANSVTTTEADMLPATETIEDTSIPSEGFEIPDDSDAGGDTSGPDTSGAD